MEDDVSCNEMIIEKPCILPREFLRGKITIDAILALFKPKGGKFVLCIQMPPK